MLSINLSSGTPERSLIICMFTLPNINLPKGELSILNLGSISGKRPLSAGYCFSKSFNRV